MNPAVIYRVLGVALWSVALVAAGNALWLSAVTDDENRSISLVRYLAGPTETPAAIDPTGFLQVGDPVFLQTGAIGWEQIGYVTRTSDAVPPTREVRLAWYASDLDSSHCELFQYHNSGRLEDVVRMLLPEEKRERIQQRLTEAFHAHGNELSSAIMPLVEQSLRESLPLIEAELRNSVSRHRREVDAVAVRLNRDVVQGRLIPLAKEQLLPIVRRHAEAPAEDIGRELWDRASIWRFGWRAVYDSTPLPRKGLVKEEWRRFVDDEVTKVLEEHMDELTVAVQRIVADVAVDPDIRRELTQAAETVASDPQTRVLVQTILKESIVDNQSLRDRWREIWTSERATTALSIAGDRLEPVVRSIGDEIFGSREGGIDPGFARVLRNQILGKDHRWIVARPSTSARDQTAELKVIRVSNETMVFPIVYLADSSQGDAQ